MMDDRALNADRAQAKPNPGTEGVSQNRRRGAVEGEEKFGSGRLELKRRTGTPPSRLYFHSRGTVKLNVVSSPSSCTTTDTCLPAD